MVAKTTFQHCPPPVLTAVTSPMRNMHARIVQLAQLIARSCLDLSALILPYTLVVQRPSEFSFILEVLIPGNLFTQNCSIQSKASVPGKSCGAGEVLNNLFRAFPFQSFVVVFVNPNTGAN